MVAKFADHLQLYRQEKIFGRIELAIACSTIAQCVTQTDVQLRPLIDALSEPVLKQGVIHADETPVQMLAPGEKKTHRAYVWSYSTTSISTLDFSPVALANTRASSCATGPHFILGLISERYPTLEVPMAADTLAHAATVAAETLTDADTA